MSTLATLTINLEANAAGVSKGLNKAKEDVGGFGSMVQNAIGTMGGFMLANMAMNAVSSVFSSAKSAVIDLNGSIEQATTVFTALTGSSSQAATHVKDLLQFAKSSPFPIESVIAASEQLQKLGGNSLNTIANLTKFGDAAGSLGVPIGDVSDKFATFTALLDSGKPVTRALIPMMKMGLVSSDTVAKVDAMTKAHASHAAILDVMYSSMDKFTGGMEKQRGTWQGLTTVFNDTIAILSAETLKPFFALFEDGFAQVNKFLSSQMFADFAKSAGAALLGLVNGGIQGLQTAIAILTPYLPQFAAGFQGIWDQLVKMVGPGGFSGLTEALRNLLPKVLDVGLALVGDVHTGLVWINDHGDFVKGVLLGIAGAFAAIQIIALATALKEVAVGLMAIDLAALPWILLGAALLILGFLLITHWTELGVLLGGFGSIIGELFSKMGTAIHNGILGWGGFFSLVGTMFQQAFSQWGAAFDMIGTAIHLILVRIGTTFSTSFAAWGDSFSLLGTAIQLIGGKMKSGWDQITNDIHNAWNGILGWIGGVVGQIVSAIQNPFRNIHISMPHFYMTGGFDPAQWAQGHNLPALGVNWYASGGLFNRPSIIGVGEAGTEAVAPVAKLQDMIANAVRGAGGSGTTISHAPVYYISGVGEDLIRKIDEAIKLNNLDFARSWQQNLVGG